MKIIWRETRREEVYYYEEQERDVRPSYYIPTTGIMENLKKKGPAAIIAIAIEVILIINSPHLLIIFFFL